MGFRCSKATSEHIHQSPTEFLLWKSQISVWTVEDRVSDLYSGCNLLGFGRLKFEFLSGIKRIFSDPKPSFGLQSMERKRFSKLRSIRTVSLRLIFLSLVAVAVSAGFVAFHFGLLTLSFVFSYFSFSIFQSVWSVCCCSFLVPCVFAFFDKEKGFVPFFSPFCLLLHFAVIIEKSWLLLFFCPFQVRCINRLSCRWRFHPPTTNLAPLPTASFSDKVMLLYKTLKK